jgi:hypothetical protein
MPSDSRLDGTETVDPSEGGMSNKPTGVTPLCIMEHAAPKQQPEAGTLLLCSPQPS